MKTLIKNGTIVIKDQVLKADLVIENNIITSISKNITGDFDKIIDAKGQYIMSGFVDMHTHLRDPGFEYKEDIPSGVRAAAKGGFTSICCMPNTNPVCDNISTVEYIIEKARRQGYTKVYPIGAITKGLNGLEISEMGRMQKAGMIAVSDDGNPVANGSVMRLAMEYADSFNILVISHCEDKSISDGGVVNEGFNATKCGLKGINRVAEESMVARELLFADTLKTKIHIAHVSTRGSVNLIRLFKSIGVKVTCETCPHYFSLNDDLICTFDTATKVNPPLREEGDRLSIIEGIIDGTIDCIATDHAPHHIDDKRVEYNQASFGISGLETAFSLAVTNLLKKNYIDIIKLNELMSLTPSKILGLYSEGIKVNAPADLTICDIDNEYVINSAKFVSKGKNTPFNCMKVSGLVTHTIIDGKVVYCNGELING